MSERRDGEERKPRDCSSVRGVCKYFWMATHVMPVYKDCSSMLDAENVEGGGGVIDCEPLATFDGQPWPAFEAVSSTDEMRSRLDKRAQQLAVFENKKKSVANLKLQRMRDKIERTEMFLQLLVAPGLHQLDEASAIVCKGCLLRLFRFPNLKAFLH